MTKDEPIRVVLVDDDKLIRAGLRQLIDDSPRFRVVGEIEVTGNLNDMRPLAPDVVVLDGDDSEDMRCIQELLDRTEAARVIVLYRRQNRKRLRQAVYYGALGVVLKEETPETLHMAIEKVFNGEVWLNRAMIAELVSLLKEQPLIEPHGVDVGQPLTARESALIHLLSQGLKNHEIADELQVSHSTIRHDLTSIYSKLGVSDRVELVILAYRTGLIPVLTQPYLP